jgi:hypothetical protein
MPLSGVLPTDQAHSRSARNDAGSSGPIGSIRVPKAATRPVFGPRRNGPRLALDDPLRAFDGIGVFDSFALANNFGT